MLIIFSSIVEGILVWKIKNSSKKLNDLANIYLFIILLFV